MSATTRDGTKVLVGQIWRDLDVRYIPRRVKVRNVNAHDGRAVVQNTVTQKITTLSINRMHKSATGWALVPEAS